MPDLDKNREPRNRRTLAEGTERETGRLEAFSDGIFAIAITLLILDVRLPQSEGNGHLLRSLLALWPSYFALVFSFVMIGIYWSQHHYVFKLYRNTDHLFNLLHLLFLLSISVLPFPTRVLADYVESEPDRATGIAFYTLALLFPAATWFATWIYAMWGRRIVDPKLNPKFVRRLTVQYGGSVALYVKVPLDPAQPCSGVVDQVAPGLLKLTHPAQAVLLQLVDGPEDQHCPRQRHRCQR
jgi:uncharacterized membrane protein